MSQIILIAHNLRSCHNVGSLLRTADGLGIQKVYLTGYTPFPKRADDPRLPHEAAKVDRQISKTALGAEHSVAWTYTNDLFGLIDELKQQDYVIAALEQTPDSQDLPSFITPDSIALVVGREVEGIEPEVLKLCDLSIEIPMNGRKESFNVVQAAAMALYHLSFAR